jgi:hypothetical protein
MTLRSKERIFVFSWGCLEDADPAKSAALLRSPSDPSALQPLILNGSGSHNLGLLRGTANNCGFEEDFKVRQFVVCSRNLVKKSA